jgi:REP element-mobilizing transposase RayT
MANTYSQIHIQVVFAVQNRESLIDSKWKNELYQYLVGIIQNHQHKVIAINGMPDHVHILIGLRPSQSISDLMQKVKGDSSKWINRKGFVLGKFSWQEGYGVFSYGKSQIDDVIEYIKRQEIHHQRKTFKEEYRQLLEKFEVDYDERFVFKDIE